MSNSSQSTEGGTSTIITNIRNGNMKKRIFSICLTSLFLRFNSIYFIETDIVKSFLRIVTEDHSSNSTILLNLHHIIMHPLQ